MARTNISVLTDPSYVPSRPGRGRPCGHALHPAVTDYRDPQCPYCRMVNAMSDLRRASDKPNARGGVHEWHEECEYDFQRRVWERATTGGIRKSNLTPTRDIHGNNSSYRSAKARFHNVLMVLEDISVKEQAWEIEPPATGRLRSAIGWLEGKEERIKHIATSALYLYTETVEQGFMSQVEKDCVSFMRKRGKEWDRLSFNRLLVRARGCS
jgi:uncharacterized protein (UPF0335 family)